VPALPAPERAYTRCMARVFLGGDDVRIHHGLFGRIGAYVRGDGVVPLSKIRFVRATNDPWAEVRGVRAPGISLGHRIALGTRRHKLGKDFVAVYGNGPAVVLELADFEFSRFVISDPDAESVAAEIQAALDEPRLPSPGSPGFGRPSYGPP